MITKTDLRDLRRILALAASKDSSADSLREIGYIATRLLRKHDASWQAMENRKRDNRERG
jgi:hypothetical protein